MELQDLLATLSALNVRLEVRDGKLQANAPAGALTGELQRAISLQKNALLQMLHSAAAAPVKDQLPQIVPNPEKRYESFPLTDVQHAYWIGRSVHMELGSVSTHIYYELECGALDPARLTESFRKVVGLHDMLRAVVDANGLQRVLETVPDYNIKVSDLRAAPPAQREKELLRIRSEMSHQLLSCEQWPLFDIRLALISDRHSRLYVSWDFLMVDGWSLMLIFQQWFSYYEDSEYQAAAPSVSFRDYVLAVERLKEQPGYQISRKYWWDRLDQLPSGPQLPVHSERSRNHEFTRRRLTLPADKWDVIKASARRLGITPTSVLLAAFSEVLNLWSKVPHYCLNMTLFNRFPLHPDVMSVVGDFTNLMALEIDAREPSSFAELAARIQARFLQDYDHRQVNVMEVLRELARRRGGEQAILPVVFTSTLMLDGKKTGDAGLLEKFGRMGYGISQTAQVWLDYQVFEINGDLVFNWDAVAEVFLPEVLDDMFESNRELLYLLARDPAAWERKNLAALPEAQQQRRNLVERTDAEVVNRCLHEIFIQRAMEDPERIALVRGGGVMRYGELLAHGNLVAEQLIRSGVRPGELVAIVMHKGWEQVVAAMGVLIAGAAYLPIEPHWPTLRRSYILEQADVRVALTQPALNRELQWPSNVHRLDVIEQTGLEPLATAPPLRQSPEDLAYVIFTSGSTGTPKGVMIPHLGAVNTIVHLNRMFNIGPEDRVLAVSDLTFDLSVYDLFGMLASGGAIVIPDAERSRDSSHWQELILRHRVTLWNSAPPLMGMLVDETESAGGRHPSLRLVWLSGDWIPVPLPDRVRHLSPGARVISMGGATEGSIWSIYYPVEEVLSSWDSIPYGRALPNQHMYVLNKALRPCPELVTGDIYIGGMGVALGYWKDPEKTARQFATHPETGERLYYTGDLGRMQRDGNIEFLGRADSQVKLRGHRVELGEITACLQSHPNIRGAAVRVLKQENRNQLVAYVVANRTESTPLPEQAEASTQDAQAISTRIEAADKQHIDGADREALHRFWRFWKDAERASLYAMLETLEALDLINGSDASDRLNQLIASGRVLPQYRHMVLRWLAALARWGHLSAHQGSYMALEGGIRKAERLEQQLLALEKSYGNDESLKGFVEHVASCLSSHLSLLCGEMNPLALLFPEGSWRVAESLYESNAVVRHHNALIAAIIKALLGSWDNDKALRVLEIGAGTGATSNAILPVLPASRTEYWYTDASVYFFSAAKEKFKSYPFVRFAVYDLNKDPNDQGYQPQSYDVIVAANVLHNALNMNEVLSRVRELLRPGGYLLLLEGTAATPWMWATVAFLEDSRVESEQWALGVEEWAGALAGSGFEAVQVFPGTGSGGLAEFLSAMPQHVIAGRASAQPAVFRPEELAAFVRERLPDYMVPQRFVLLDKLPLTSNGKIDVAALPAELASPASGPRQVVSPMSEAEELILNIWKDVLGVEQLSVIDNFFEAGGDSLLITEVMRKLNRTRPSPLTITELLAYPTIRSLADYLSSASEASGPVAVANVPAAPRASSETQDIAIIGMAGRFPDADDVEQFWRNIAAGKCAVRHFTDEELLRAGVSPQEFTAPNYVRAGLVLRDIDCFDASFFGFTPRDAEIMDPQQRFLLECAVEVLENAGYPNEKQAGRIGVFVGKGTSLYLLESLLPNTELIQRLGMMPLLNFNEKDYAATLLSYKLSLTGPSINVNTACSTSLVAVHLACESLLKGECDIAVAGGVSFVNLGKSGYVYQEGHILSPDGLCRAFSDDANGTVFGSGVGLVALKPLVSALRDRDTIHAVIKGSAINNDGAQKVSFTAPSLHGQAEVISKAQIRAAASPDTIQLIEAHGTGTGLGDPVEFGALRKVFGGPRKDGSRCSLGAVKSNIGHLDAAAGIAGLIKVVQALKYEQIPPTLHVSVPTRKVDFADSPFELTPVLKNWPAGAAARRAGVSAFGVGGTNAHVVVEEAPAVQPRTTMSGYQVLPVSAKSPESLKAMVRALAEEFGKRPELNLEDVAFTLQVGRNAYPNRICIVCDRLSAAEEQFAQPERLILECRSKGHKPEAVFLFPGQGSLEMDATYELYQNEARFRGALDECAAIVQQYAGEDLRHWLYSKNAGSKARVRIEQTAITQPVLFSVEYALARFWESLGIRPAAMLGHSLGEYVAACVAGVFSLPEALSLMIVRGRLLQSLPPGQMLAVACSEAQLRQLLEGSMCCLAAVNGPSQCVASGSSADIAALQKRLQAEGIPGSILRTSHAFHSHMVEPVLQTFENCVAEIERRPPVTPFISNVTGTWITDAEAMSPAYWSQHLRQTVRFGDGLQQVLGIRNCVLLEVGPGNVLTSLVKQTDRSVPAIASLSRSALQDERRTFLEAVGQLWLHGAEIDWAPLHEGSQPRRVPLPSYAFERKRYWIEQRRRLFNSHPVAIEIVQAAQPEVTMAEPAAAINGSHENGHAKAESFGPRDAIEVRLVEIWKSYLGVESIGVRQSFFEMGGDSLLASRLHSQLRREFNVELPLAMMFELETIRHLALYITISRDPELVDTLSERDLDDVLAVLEAWPAEGRPRMAKRAITS